MHHEYVWTRYGGDEGKKIRRGPEPIIVMENISLPLEIYEQHRNTMVSVDYIHMSMDYVIYIQHQENIDLERLDTFKLK